jgi:hypothetical protein
MKGITPALFLYFISGFLFVSSIIFGAEYLTMIFKPIIIPSIFFYYLQKSDGKASFWFSIILIFLFISNIFNLFDDKLFYVLVFNLFAYIILFFSILKIFIRLKLKKFDNVNLMFVFITFLFLCFLLYITLFMIFDSNFELYLIIILYAVALLFLAGLSTIMSMQNHNEGNDYLLIAVFCFITSDLFFALYYYYYDFLFFRYISIISNTISFYFLVNYFLFWKSNTDIINEEKL